MTMQIEKIGNATLYLGDCMDILPTLEKVDAVITDPPYGINFAYQGYEDTPANLQNLIDFFVPICIFIAKRTVITPGNTNLTKYPPADWYGCWTFDTTSSRGKLGWSNWQPIIFYGEDIGKGTKNINGHLKSDRIHCTQRPDQMAIDKSHGHPCAKSIDFMQKLLSRFSLANELILDPFMGSGTTGVACAQLGRSFIGIEREPAYFDIACRRIEQAYKQGQLFEHEPIIKQIQGDLL